MKKLLYWKSVLRNISHSKGRFLSIFIIVFLGAGVFSGLRNSPKTMGSSVDNYLDAHNYADLTYLATLGFTREDVEEIRKVKGVENISEGYRADARFELDDTFYGVTVLSQDHYDDEVLDQPLLLEGRYPNAKDQCLIDVNLKRYGYDLNSNIELENDNGTETYTIVGIVNDVRYISELDRGTNSLGDGSNVGFVEIMNEGAASLCVPEALYKLRDEDILYTSILVKVKGASEYNVFGQEYLDHIDPVDTKIKSLMTEKFSSLYDDLTGDASKKLKKAEKAYKEGQEEYNDSYAEYKKTVNNAKKKLIEAKFEVARNKKIYFENKRKINQANKSLAKEISSLNNTIDELKKELEETVNELSTKEGLETKHTVILDIDEQIDNLKKRISSISKLLDSDATLEEAKVKLEEAQLEIEKQENNLELQEIEAEKNFEKAKNKLNKAQKQIAEAKGSIRKIPKGVLYSLTFEKNEGLAVFKANMDAIQSIANVFPFIFFLVAALVCLTTMTRMVEEQRSYCGTLRALGYSKADIYKQYLVYAFSATFFASVIGIIAGNQIFPKVIYSLYMYMMLSVGKEIVLSQSPIISAQTIFISVFVTTVATLSACASELSLMPSVLMRPKAPKIGKRILLEKIGFIWKRLNFNRKVTMRNIFRYKKRFLMSILGIAGCTGLIIVGFGIKESISRIVPLQYEHIQVYDGAIRLNNTYRNQDALTLEKQIKNIEGVTNATMIQSKSIEIIGGSKDLYGTLYVYHNSDNIQNFLKFYDYRSKKNLKLSDDGVVISQKASELMKVKEGDTCDLLINDTKYNVKIEGICENYYIHYIFMSQTLYENLTTEQFAGNTIYVHLKNTKQSTKNALESFIKTKKYGSVQFMDSIGDEFSKRIESLNIITVILIVCAGLLCFVVLYNLTNINIGEREREIATIKVLGFRRKEYCDYIFRENVFLSLIGGFLGIPIGIILHRFIISSVELDATIFYRTLPFYVFIVAYIITVGFTYLINIFMRRILDRVDMVESLKSIE